MSWSLMGVKELDKHSVVKKKSQLAKGDLMDLGLQDRTTDLNLGEPRKKI